MTPEEREHSQTLVYQLLPSRYGMNPDDLRRADAIEVVVGQGAKPGGGGMLLGHKISDRVAEMRDLPKGIDQRSACRHPDWTGPDDLEIKIEELREITDWRIPIYIKVGATRTYYDVALAVKAGADAIVLDGMQGGTAATQEVFIEHVGIPILAAIPQAVESLVDLGMHREVQLIVSGGIRTGADVAKALALGADAVSIGVAALIALGDNAPEHDAGYREIGSAAGYYDDYQAGLDPAGISTQDPELAARLDPVEGGRRLANYLRTMTLEAQTLARACGKSHVHNLEPEDLVALTIEAAAMARVPLAGTSWIPGASRLKRRDQDEDQSRDRAGGGAPADRADRRALRARTRRDRALRPLQGEGVAVGDRSARRGRRRQARVRRRDDADESRRGQDNDGGRPHPGPRRDRQVAGAVPARALARPGVRDQGRRRRRRPHAGRADGGPEPSLHRRHPRRRRANNLLAALLDASILHGNALKIDALRIGWRRAVDMNDRALREIVLGLGGRPNGYPREAGFDITAASEVMAILAVARDLHDLRRRLGAITVALLL